jgi:hypothetical protein
MTAVSPDDADLDRDEFHVQSSGLGKSSQVIRLGCQDLVAIARQAHDRIVDRIGPTASPQKHSRSLAEADVQSFDIDSGKKPCEYGPTGTMDADLNPSRSPARVGGPWRIFNRMCGKSSTA